MENISAKKWVINSQNCTKAYKVLRRTGGLYGPKYSCVTGSQHINMGICRHNTEGWPNVHIGSLRAQGQHHPPTFAAYKLVFEPQTLTTHAY